MINRIGETLGASPASLGRGNSRQLNGINRRPFLDPADGGTGTQLRRTEPKNSTSPRLNPDDFR